MSDPHDEGHHAPPPLPEPTTPMWLPALGVALFVLAGAWWVGMTKSAPTADAATMQSADAGQATPPPTHP